MLALPFYGLARITGRSMEPTLREGDRVLVRWDRATRRARVGHLVVVRLGGDRPVAVKRLTAKLEDGWWVERDSASHGVDSWLLGAVPDADLLGVVRLRVWPRPRVFRARIPPRRMQRGRGTRPA